ncbi:hypothetical protein [Aeromonas dhakensis]|uniref:hypothetical protein n=1 Tax=Aeromonas dhakensis TaxID=196024 RepID=UPI000F888E13|nr:hypothetical protein [Aeromonas dhakensis]RUQ10674.1 hypothetical protein CX648_20965 [Aeromonas dhakensis]
MKQHTSELWVQVGDFVAAESDQLNGGEYVCGCFGPDQEANARRIVACVNFCAGISTENLEGNEKLLWLAEQYNEVKSLRSHAEAQVRHFQERLAVFQAQFSKAKTLIHDLRTPVETGLHNAKVMNCPLGVEKREDELRRIEEILNWKEAD